MLTNLSSSLVLERVSRRGARNHFKTIKMHPREERQASETRGDRIVEVRSSTMRFRDSQAPSAQGEGAWQCHRGCVAGVFSWSSRCPARTTPRRRLPPSPRGGGDVLGVGRFLPSSREHTLHAESPPPLSRTEEEALGLQDPGSILGLSFRGCRISQMSNGEPKTDKIYQTKWTLSNGYLGSCNDEERSEMRYLV